MKILIETENLLESLEHKISDYYMLPCFSFFEFLISLNLYEEMPNSAIL